MTAHPIATRLRQHFVARFGTIPTDPPIVIGATGGSGTRALHAALAAAGVYMGARLNGAGDAMDFEPFLDDVINPVLTITRSPDYRLEDLPPDMRRRWTRRLTGIARLHVADGGSMEWGWGWKNPRSMYILPLIAAVVPEFRFVHLVRDGRDMALSSNQNQTRKHFEALFGEAAPEVPEHANIRLWARANSAVADWGERALGERYLRVRFEDLCAAPGPIINRILAMLPSPARHGVDIARRSAAEVSAPESIERWRTLDPTVMTALAGEASDVLTRFGYPLET
ncbi:MAG: sulfotransferase [Alphaproteobacteria bacterium]|nr:sulfotransferase [Alphaproteobacteria bacterium]